MATKQEFLDEINASKAEATRINTRITELETKINEGGMTAAEEAEVLTELTGFKDQLKGVGVTPPS